jgi:hypothetical protein
MIYIGHFLVVTNQQAAEETERRHGDFSLIVESDNYQNAVDKFKERITSYRETSDLFEGDCSVFFLQLLEFVEIPKDEAMMMSYKSYAGSPDLPFIGCSVPSGQEKSCSIYNWEEEKLEVDGYKGKLFIDFKK